MTIAADTTAITQTSAPRTRTKRVGNQTAVHEAAAGAPTASRTARAKSLPGHAPAKRKRTTADPAPAPVGAVAADPISVLPQRSTKRNRIVAMLKREEGASLDELIAATGWLPHTTRAALSGLRKAGMAVARSTSEGASRYRILG